MNMKKMIFVLTVAINIILIAMLASMYSKLANGKEIASNEILHQLIHIETIIGEQLESDWNHPESVSKRLDTSLKTMQRSFELMNESSIIKNTQESNVVSSVLRKLELYRKAEPGNLTLKDIADFEKLRGALNKAGIGQGTSITVNDYDAFMEIMKSLNHEMVNPLEE